MPKYYCDYCDTYLTHDSPSVRKTHCSGRKHKDNVRTYYQTWMEEQAQELIDKTTQAFQQGKIANNPFGMTGVAPVPPQMAAVMRPGMAPMMGAPPMAVPMPGQHMMMPGQAPQMMGVRAMRPPMQAPPQMMMMSGPPPPRPPM